MNLADFILETSYTRSDALERLRGLQEGVVGKIFKKEGAKDQADLPAEIVKQFDKDNVERLFSEAEGEIKSIEALVVYAPVKLEAEHFSKLGQWLRKNYGEKFLMEIKYDPGLIAGAALAWKGRMRDFSLREKLLRKKDDIKRELSYGHKQKQQTIA